MTPRYITVKGGGISASTPFYIGHVQHDRTMSRREAYEYLSQQTGFRPAPTLTGINSPEQESPGIEWDSGIEMHGTGLALGSGDKVEAKLEGDPSAQWYDLTGYVDGESSGAELIVLGGDSWEVLGDDVGLDADHTSARFRVTVGGQSAEIVGTALVP